MNNPCTPEFIDGSYHGCGVCWDCLQDEYDAIEADVEYGHLTEDEALELHRHNGAL